MKWYFALNEAGCDGDAGLHAKLAVLSAEAIGGLQPILLYIGARNALTAWMQARGVTVIDARPSFAEAVEAVAERHPAPLMGHWLRVMVCEIERDDAYVLYTDCDVVFRKSIDFSLCTPTFFAGAPEMRQDDWSYVNCGVLVLNVEGLRREHAGFEAYILNALQGPGGSDFNDQHAYNTFFAGRWSRLHPWLNWKPYWGFCEEAAIAHFHGPKIGQMRTVLDGAALWDEALWRLYGALFITSLPHYAGFLEEMTPFAEAAGVGELVAGIARDARRLYRIVPLDRLQAPLDG